MMNLKETIELIQETAVAARAVKDVSRLIGNHRVCFIQHGNEIKSFPVPPPVRCHTVHSLDDLLRYAEELKNLSIYQAADIGGQIPTVWHGDDSVILLLNDADRQDRVTFPLSHSERFRQLQHLRDEKPYFNQQSFVYLLRFRLGVAADVVNQFRRLEWRDGGSTAIDIHHGNSKLGRSIVSEVQGVDKLPEELPISVPVYCETEERREYAVMCGIEIDTANQRVMIAPLPDELDRVIDLAQKDIHRRLTAGLNELDIPMFYGKP
jgi:hypothetical protein